MLYGCGWNVDNVACMQVNCFDEHASSGVYGVLHGGGWNVDYVAKTKVLCLHNADSISEVKLRPMVGNEPYVQMDVWLKDVPESIQAFCENADRCAAGLVDY